CARHGSGQRGPGAGRSASGGELSRLILMRSSPSGAEVEAYLHRHIPLSAQMGVSVVTCDATGVTLRAPLAPNINHHSTVFGGSTSAVGILSAWAWLHFALRSAGHTSRLVIQ